MKHLGDLSIPRIAAYYSHVAADRLAEFQAFCRDFPYRELSHGGMTWHYLAGGRGEPPVLLLPGALTHPDISWHTICNFSGRRAVIAPAYPPVMTMDALVDGIAAILEHEGVRQVHVLGGSYGGFVAQVFVRRHARLVRSLALSHTLGPSPEMVSRMRRSARLLRWLPLAWVRRLARRTFQSMMPPRTDETACLLANFDELTGDALTKPDFAGILERMADFSGRAFSAADLADWPGRTLLVFGENDPATPPDVRSRLEALYPGCRVHLFTGSGHTTSVTRQDEYLSLIDDFFAQP